MCAPQIKGAKHLAGLGLAQGLCDSSWGGCTVSVTPQSPRHLPRCRGEQEGTGRHPRVEGQEAAALSIWVAWPGWSFPPLRNLGDALLSTNRGLPGEHAINDLESLLRLSETSS